jgi:hypothetical protein
MTNLLGTLFFLQSDQNVGWSESYYLIGSDYTAAGADLFVLLNTRLALLRPTVLCTRARVSDTLIRGDAYLEIGLPSAGTWNPTGSADSEPWTCLFLRRSSGVLYFSNLFLHGVPEDQIVNGNYSPTGPYITVVNQFVAALKNLTELWVRNKQPPPVGKIRVPVTRVVVEGLTPKKVGRPFGLRRGRRQIV